MGKRIISQARGHGGKTYRVRRQAYKYRIGYPSVKMVGDAVIVKLINSSGHSAPLAKIMIDKTTFYNPACQGNFEGQKIVIGGSDIEIGNIMQLKHLPIGTRIFNIEKKPGDGGKICRTSGSFATVIKTSKENSVLLMSNKKEIKINGDCRVTIGMIAGQGRIMKPVVRAGKKHHMMKSRNKFWPRTSAVKVNAVDHPFGGGRGKRIKSKIAKRNSPPGRKVGHILPRKTGKRK